MENGINSILTGVCGPLKKLNLLIKTDETVLICFFISILTILSLNISLTPRIIYTQDELIEQIRGGNQKAFSYLYDNYSKALFGVINTIVKDVSEAEDVLQRTFLKIWDNFASYDSNKGRLYTWMLNIARNMAIDSTRSKHEKMKTQTQSTTDTVYNLENKLSEPENEQDFIGFKKILDVLMEDQKLVIDLAYFEGYTQDEISKKLNIPLGTVKTKVRQAILKLRELTEKEFLQ